MRAIRVGLSIARGSNDRVSIRVQDEASRVQFLLVDLSLEDFARAVTAMHVSGASAEIRGLDLVGLRHEIKHEVVPFDCYGGDYDARAARASAALRAYEVDGWRGDVADLFNGHRTVRDEGQLVAFHRHVREDGSPVLPEERR